jgi:spermidine/putrescine transport system permease protein
MAESIAASRWASRSLKGYFLLLALFLYAPLVILALFSLNDSNTIGFPLSGFTTRWYGAFLENDQLLGSLRASVVVAAVSSIIAVALGVCASMALVRRRFRGKGVVSALVLSPLVIPYLVFGISLLILFTTVDKILTDAFGVFIGLGLHTIVIGHIVISLPYTVLVIMPRLQRLSTTYEEAARDLGASAFQSFRRVTLPLLMPAIVSSFLIAFTLSFDEYAIAGFLAGEQATWPVYLFSQLRVPILLPQLIAISVVILFVSLALVGGTEVFRRRTEQRLDTAVGGGG